MTSKLLTVNPEYYTIWNYRRKLIQLRIDQIRNRKDLSEGSINKGSSRIVAEGNPKDEASEANQDQITEILNLIQSDLSFLIPLLRGFPKCYWLWKYRLWLLSLGTSILPFLTSYTLWEQDLTLVGKMLTLDSRNFHGWGYRRIVIAALEKGQAITEKKSMAEQEFDYTTKMINNNLSNFSAWHNRSKLIPRMLDERQASKKERIEMLNAELEMVQRALWADAEDQSLWFYHQALICAFSHQGKYREQSVTPDLSTDERLKYLTKEIENLVDMLDGAEDCKWIYQRLIELCIMYREQAGSWAEGVERVKVLEWVEELKKLDSLRLERWKDLETSLKDKYGS